MEKSLYTEIDSQELLDELMDSICWDDSELRNLFVCNKNLNSFPKDLPFDVKNSLNFFCLFQVCSAPKSHLEVVFINSNISEDLQEEYRVFESFPFYWKFESDKKLKYNESTVAERALFRFVELEDGIDESNYFSVPGFWDYENYRMSEEGYSLIEKSKNESLLVTTKDDLIELSISSNNSTKSITLNSDEIVELQKALKVLSQQ